MKKMLSLLIPVIALVGGVAAGDILGRGDKSPDHAVATDVTEPDASEHAGDEKSADHGPPHSADEHAVPEDDHASAAADHGGGHDAASAAEAWFTFPSQFFVPMMRNGDMGAVMILTLSLETSGAELAAMKQQEHRLRDALLRELLIHANTGGFDGNFTAESRIAPLRDRLLEAAKASTDLTVQAVLIEDIARQAG